MHTTNTPTTPETLQPATTPSPSAAALFSIGGRQLLVALRYLLMSLPLVYGLRRMEQHLGRRKKA